MSFEIAPHTSHYSSKLQPILDTYPNSKTFILDTIATKTQDFTLKNKIRFLTPGIRKLKIPLPEYEISASRGLRVIYIIAKQKIRFITIYSKSELNKSKEINSLIAVGWKEVFATL